MSDRIVLNNEFGHILYVDEVNKIIYPNDNMYKSMSHYGKIYLNNVELAKIKTILEDIDLCNPVPDDFYLEFDSRTGLGTVLRIAIDGNKTDITDYGKW